jgi:dephospho-CoA kinase
VLVVGLTGGIGSGKSTVAGMLAGRGARVLDADAVAREVVAPGSPTHEEVVRRFGRALVAENGRLDRAGLAALVFADERARNDLNRIVHPAVRDEVLRRLAAAEAADPHDVVVLEIPLLAEVGPDRYPLAGVIVVDLPVDVAVDRLQADRGFSEADARARVAAQATRAERRAIGDVVIDNSGDLAHLRTEVDRAWAWIQTLDRPS